MAFACTGLVYTAGSLVDPYCSRHSSLLYIWTHERKIENGKMDSDNRLMLPPKGAGWNCHSYFFFP